MKEFDIDLENTDGCFAPGDPIAGHVVLRSTAFNAPLREPPPAGLVPFPLQLLEFISLKIRLYGSAQLKTQLRGVLMFISGINRFFMKSEPESFTKIEND
jgi:hypothetical protein